MGPLFFLIYVDDLCFATTSVSLDAQFADDTAASVGVKIFHGRIISTLFARKHHGLLV
jgi:hypothetical protein